MRDLTKRQAQVLDAITSAQRKGNPVPTCRELAAMFGMTSANGVTNHLIALERKGKIKRERGKSRAIVVVQDKRRRGWPLITLDQISR